MKKSLAACLLLIAVALLPMRQAEAQHYVSREDSLQRILQKQLADSVRADVLNALSTMLHGLDYARAAEAAGKAASLSAAAGYAFGEAKAYQNIALTSWANGRYKDALRYHKKAIAMFVAHGFEGELAEAYNKLGLVYFYIADYDEAIGLLNRAADRFRAQSDTANLARVLNNLGLVYDSRGNYATSTRYIVESLQLKQSVSQLRDQQNRTYNRNLIHENEFINNQLLAGKLAEIDKLSAQRRLEKLANVYVEVAEMYFFKKEFSEALGFYRQAESLYARLDMPVLVGHCLRDQAECHVELDQPELAVEYFKRAEAIYLRMGNLIRLGAVLSQLGDTYAAMGNTALAIDHYQRVIAMDDTIGHRNALSKMKATLAGVLLQEGRQIEAIPLAREAYEIAVRTGSLIRVESSARQLYLCYKAAGNMHEALRYLEQSTSLRQQFDDELANRQIAELQIGYETAEKQEKINQLSQITSLNANVLALQRQLIVLLSVSLLAFIVLLALVNNRFKTIKKLNTSIEEQRTQIMAQNTALEKKGRERELLIGEIHHRVKNNLQIISSLLRLQQRNISDAAARQAILEGQNRVQSMSLLHQRLYQQGTAGSVKLHAYAEDVFEHLLKVYKVKLGEVELNARCDIITLDVDTAVTFGLVMNEVFSNIFKHAYRVGRPMVVDFDCRQAGDDIHVTVADNGPGFSDTAREKQNSFGLNLVRMMTGELRGRAVFKNRQNGGAVVAITFKSQTVLAAT